MPFHLQHIEEALAQHSLSGDAWQPVRAAALQRLQNIGLPRTRSNEFFWVPQSTLAQINLPPVLAAVATPYPATLTDGWIQSLASENDLAAILPALLSAGPRQHQVIANNEWQELDVLSTDPYALELVLIPAHAKVRIRWHRVPGAAFSAQRLDLQASEGSQVEVVVFGNSEHKSMSLRHSRVRLDADATVQWLESDLGANLARTSLDAHLAGTAANFSFRALSLLEGLHQSHRRLRVFHEAAGVHSEQFVRHILQGESNASCDTLVEIQKDVTGSDAHQLVNSLLMSPHCKASAKPTLIIHNDDVKASHGTTCGDLDKNHLFYLNSRGLSDAEARRILLSAFANTLLEAHPASNHRAQIIGNLHAALRLRFP